MTKTIHLYECKTQGKSQKWVWDKVLQGYEYFSVQADYGEREDTQRHQTLNWQEKKSTFVRVKLMAWWNGSQKMY